LRRIAIDNIQQIVLIPKIWRNGDDGPYFIQFAFQVQTHNEQRVRFAWCSRRLAARALATLIANETGLKWTMEYAAEESLLSV
jgi:hypothetical protein